MRVMDLERDFQAIRAMLRGGQAPGWLVLVGATRRSMPLAVIAATKGIVVGVLPQGASARELALLKARERPDAVLAYRDIAQIMAAESAKDRAHAGISAPPK